MSHHATAAARDVTAMTDLFEAGKRLAFEPAA